MSAGLRPRLIPKLGYCPNCVKCYEASVCTYETVCVWESETEKTRRSQLRRLVLLSHRQPVQASSGWKVVDIRWNLKHHQLPGPRGKGYRRRCLQHPFKKAGDYLPQRNGSMGLHQPGVRWGRAGGVSLYEATIVICSWLFFVCLTNFLPLLLTSPTLRQMKATSCHDNIFNYSCGRHLYVKWNMRCKQSFRGK